MKRSFKNSFSQVLDSDIKNLKLVEHAGLRFILEPIKHVHSVSLGFFFNLGSRDEQIDKRGTAHFLEHMIFRGSAKRGAKRLSTEFEKTGTESNAFTTKELTCYYFRSLPEYFNKNLDILSDIVLMPALKDNLIEKERAVIIDEINSYEDDYEELIHEDMDKLLFQGHALANPIAGSIDDLNKLTKEDVVDYHKIYGKENLIISIAGNIEAEKVINSLISKLNSFSSKIEKTKRTNDYQYIPKELVIEKPSGQTHVLYAKPMKLNTYKDRYIALLFNILFGDGMSSRLYRSIREKHGLAYTVFSSIQYFSDISAFYIYSAIDSKSPKKLQNALDSQICKLADGLKDSELQKSKNQLLANLLMDLESSGSKMQFNAKNIITYNEIESYNSIYEIINQITLQDMEQFMSEMANIIDYSRVIYTKSK